jgi:hypothetical protein
VKNAIVPKSSSVLFYRLLRDGPVFASAACYFVLPPNRRGRLGEASLPRSLDY